MRHIFSTLFLIVLMLPISAGAHEEKALDVQLRLTPTGSGAGYMKIQNQAKNKIRLIGAKSPFIDKIEIHHTKMQNGIMKMEAVKGIDIGPGKTVHLKPGGRHLMLFGVMPTLKVGETIPLTLIFDGDHRLKVRAEIVPLTGKRKMHKHHKMKKKSEEKHKH